MPLKSQRERSWETFLLHFSGRAQEALETTVTVCFSHHLVSHSRSLEMIWTVISSQSRETPAARCSVSKRPPAAGLCRPPLVPDAARRAPPRPPAPESTKLPLFSPKPGGKQHASVGEVQRDLGWRVGLEPRGTRQAISSLFNTWGHGPLISSRRHGLQELLG